MHLCRRHGGGLGGGSEGWRVTRHSLPSLPLDPNQTQSKERPQESLKDVFVIECM